MGFLNNIKSIGLGKLAELSSMSVHSTTSGIGKDTYQDWHAMTSAQRGYFSALTMARNLQGAALTFRCRPNDPQHILSLSISKKSDKQLFEENKTYKVRMEFSNTIILYGHLNAYKEKHAMILGVSSEFMENITDSSWVKLQFVGAGGKKFTTRFSLNGAQKAIEAVIARADEEQQQDSPWFLDDNAASAADSKK
jgi:hypothetical protein